MNHDGEWIRFLNFVTGRIQKTDGVVFFIMTDDWAFDSSPVGRWSLTLPTQRAAILCRNREGEGSTCPVRAVLKSTSTTSDGRRSLRRARETHSSPAAPFILHDVSAASPASCACLILNFSRRRSKKRIGSVLSIGYFPVLSFLPQLSLLASRPRRSCTHCL